MKPDQELQARRARARYLLVGTGILAAGAAGYAGFVIFVGSQPGAGPGVGVLVLAATTGFAAFFSPCSFPLMLTFLTRQASQTRTSAVASATAVGLGAIAFLTLVAVLIGSGASAVSRVVAFDSVTGRVFRFGVGALLIGLGLHQARALALRLRWPDRLVTATARFMDPSRLSSRVGRDFLYGFGYLLVGFG